MVVQFKGKLNNFEGFLSEIYDRQLQKECDKL